MSFFIGIGCPWLLIAAMLLWAHRRSEDPTAGRWRSEPSTLFGGPDLSQDAGEARSDPTGAVAA